MQTTLAVEDIRMTLPELLDTLGPGDEVILTRNQQPVAKLARVQMQWNQLRPGPALCKDMIASIADDFDARWKIERTAWNN